MLWITLGQDLDESRLLDRLVEACRCLHDHYSLSPATGPARVFAEPRTVAAAARLFGQLLGEHRLLVVVDDAWRASDLEPFLAGGGRCVRLVTTRLDEVVPEDATRVDIDQMTSGQARRVLTAGLPPGSDAAAGPLEAMAGGWVLLARLINSRLRRELRRTGDLATAAEVVAGLLADEGITALDAANETSRARAAGATLTVSLDALDEASRQRFETLAIFPEDTPIPAEVLARVWQRSPAATRGLLADLADDHLVQHFDPQAGTVRLHDVVRRWLRRRLAGERLRALNDQLLEATRPQSTRWSDLPETGTYLWRWAGWHLAEAGRTAELAGTVRSIDYLARKTCWLGPAAVETDLRLAATLLPSLDPLARRYQQTAHLFTQIADPLQVAANISARLGDLTSKEWTTPQLYLEPDPHWPLRDIDPQQERVYDHGGTVGALAWAPDGRLASGGPDGKVRIWPADGGSPQMLDHGGYVWRPGLGPRRQAGQRRPPAARCGSGPRTAARPRCSTTANACTPWPGPPTAGWPAAASTARCGSGRRTAARPRCSTTANTCDALAWAPDGRLASGGRRRQGADLARGRRPAPGARPRRKRGRPGLGPRRQAGQRRRRRHGADLARGRRPAPDARPRRIRVRPWPGPPTAGWPAAATTARCGSGPRTAARPRCSTTAEPCRPWPGAPAAGWPAAATTARCGSGRGRRLTPDARPRRDTCRPWPGAPTAGWPAAATTARCGSGRRSGGSPQVLDHGGNVYALAWAPGGRLASGGSDGTVRIWPADGGSPQMLDHGGTVDALAWGPDGRLASGGGGGTVRIWPADGGSPQLLDHGGTVYALAWAPDGRLASGGNGGKVRIWPADGGSPQMLDHGGTVYALAWAPDGRLASGGDGGTVRIWPADGGSPQMLDHGGTVARPGLGPRRQAGQRRQRRHGADLAGLRPQRSTSRPAATPKRVPLRSIVRRPCCLERPHCLRYWRFSRRAEDHRA